MKIQFVFRRYVCLLYDRRFFSKFGLLHHRDKTPDFTGLGGIVND